jgi:hypothetical protein
MRSPESPTTRLMNVCDDTSEVGREHGIRVPSPSPAAPQRGGDRSAPRGGWNTTIWPTLGAAPTRCENRFTSTRSPTCSVGSIDALGIRYGLTAYACTDNARPSATATTSASSNTACRRTRATKSRTNQMVPREHPARELQSRLRARAVGQAPVTYESGSAEGGVNRLIAPAALSTAARLSLDVALPRCSKWRLTA